MCGQQLLHPPPGHPGRGAARSDAPQIRDLGTGEMGPVSALHHYVLQCARDDPAGVTVLQEDSQARPAQGMCESDSEAVGVRVGGDSEKSAS